MRYIFFLFLSLWTTWANAVYDQVAINIIPTEDATKFCFNADVPGQDMYLAFTENYQDFWFLFLDENEGLSLTPLLSENQPPIFLPGGSRLRPSCLGPFPYPSLANITLFAGAGSSFADMAVNQRYAPIFTGYPPAAASSVEKDWTVMVYMVGSSLEQRPQNMYKAVTPGHGSKDILEMLAGTSGGNDNINLVLTTGGSIREGWKTVKRRIIQSGQQHILEDLGMKNMAAPETLTNFVTWAVNEYPARHYALILWNHGNGTGGFGQDTSSMGNNQLMGLAQMAGAYRDIRASLGRPLDIVVYDACLMASIEVAEVTSTLADIMAASAETEPYHGLDYHHLLGGLVQAPPDDGLAFGRLVKAGYLQHAQAEGTWESKQITYSLFDLNKLSGFAAGLEEFADYFKTFVSAYAVYENFSQGLIRAPGYPSVNSGKFRNLRVKPHIRIDFYNVLQTVGEGDVAFHEAAQALLNMLDEIIIEHDKNPNVSDVLPDAGRLSVDIGLEETSYLAVLPAGYTRLQEALQAYNERREGDLLIPEGNKICAGGIICAFAQWLELEADDVLAVEAYYGQAREDGETVYRLDEFFYTRQDLNADLELPVASEKACRYQLCADQSTCRDTSLVERGNRLNAEITLNDAPAILSFCRDNDGTWRLCGVLSRNDGIWGRNENRLYPGDNVITSTLHLQNNTLENRQGTAFTVPENADIYLHAICDQNLATVSAAYYGLNRQTEYMRLCDSGDCFCEENEDDEGCQRFGAKAGVYLRW